MQTRFWTLPIFTSLLLAAGCQSETAPLEDNFDDSVELTTSGCADVIIYSHTADDTIALFFRSEGQVAETFEAGETRTYELALGVDASLEVQQGQQLTKEICNDVIEMDDRPEVERTYTAVSGTATLVVEPGADEWSSTGTLTLTDVVLSATDDLELLIESYGPVEAGIGWLPG